MTVGIGVLASSLEGRQKGIRPDHVILISDTMGSFGDEYSHPRVHKRFDLPKNKAYVLAANRIDVAAELVSIIDSQLSECPIKQRTYASIAQAINMAFFMFKGMKFTESVFPRFRLKPDIFDRTQLTKEVNELLQPLGEIYS